MKSNENAWGAVSGSLLSAAFWWNRLDDDTQRRLRNIQIDTRDVKTQINDLLSSGDFIRLYISVVRDAIAGLAIANKQDPVPRPIPVSIPLNRPHIAEESAAASYEWPPRPGVYDGQGNVRGAGEITPFFLALTYQEVRAGILGMAQEKVPTREALTQIWRAFNALTASLSTQNRSWDQFKQIWDNLWAKDAESPAADPHHDPSRAPSVLNIGPLVASVVPLTSASIPGFPYANRNTDSAMRFRVTAGPAGIQAGAPIAQFRYGTEYRHGKDGIPFQPVALVNSGTDWVIDDIQSSGFHVQSRNAIPGNAFLPLSVVTVPGVETR